MTKNSFLAEVTFKHSFVSSTIDTEAAVVLRLKAGMILQLFVLLLHHRIF